MTVLRSPLLRRLLAGLTQLALFLPFVVVTDCNTQEVTRYRGLDVVAQTQGWMLLASVAALALLIVPVARDPAVGDAWRAFVAALGGGITLFSVGTSWLFDDPQPLVGGWLSGCAWVGLWGATVLSALPSVWREKGRVDPAFYAVALLPHAIGIVAALPTEEVWTILGLSGLGLFLLLPILIGGITLSRRAPTDPSARLRLRVLFGLAALVNGCLAVGMREVSVPLAVVALIGTGVAVARIAFPWRLNRR